jgi:hypothetical protein
MRDLRLEMIQLRSEMSGLLAEGNADRRGLIRTTVEGLTMVAEEERAVRAAITRDRPTVERGIRP